MTDVHFGRASVTDADGYKEYIICNITSIQILDGVLISPARRGAAQNKLESSSYEYQAALQLIEDDFRGELQSLSSKQRSKESHSSVFEREMSDALKELQGKLRLCVCMCVYVCV